MYSIKIDGLQKIRDKFAKAPSITTPILEKATKDAGVQIFREEVMQAPHDTGNLQRMIKSTYRPIEITIEPTANYSPYVNFGTKPHMPPTSALKAWAVKRGLNPYAVAKSIATKGTQANDFVGRTVENVSDKVNEIFNSALEKIVKTLGD